MPEPRPEQETKDEWLERCIPGVLEDEGAETQEQAIAICESMWEQAQNAYECECLSCGHVFTSEKHCRDTTCPECESEDVRRAERPASNLHWFTVNEVASVRNQNVDGTEYLVAPIVLIREGVLNGELVKAGEFNKHYGSWNGRPFVVDHPRDQEDNAVTANDPLTLAGQNPSVSGGLKVGELYNTEPDGDRLRSEIWIPIEQARHKGGEALDVMERLRQKQRLEVSTAYWRDFEPRKGEWNGQPYEGVALNLKPDHVAGLLDAVGACSWQDGCGAPRVNEECDMKENVLSTARTPDYSGTSTGEWSRPRFEDFGFEEGSVNDLTDEQKRRVASISLLGDPQADSFSEMTFFPVVDADGDLYENALDAVLGGRGAQADIPADALESARAKARSLLESEFDRDLEQEQAQNLLLRLLRVVANWFEGETQVNDETEEEGNMERDALIAELLENTELNEEELGAMTDCGLKYLAELVKSPEVNEEPEPVEEPEVNEPEVEEGPDYVTKGEYQSLFDQMVERMDALEAELHAEAEQKHNELVKALAANERCAVSEDKLAAMDIETLEGLKQSLVPADYSGNGGGPQANGERRLVSMTPRRSLKEVDNG